MTADEPSREANGGPRNGIARTVAETIPYTPQRLENPLAANYIPSYLHPGFQDSGGRPDPKIRDDFYGQRRKIRIGILGAGISSLNFLHFAETTSKDYEVVVYERNEDAGGVWLTSRYPGTRCDIPSMVYQFSWRPQIWSEMYAPAKENLEYLQMVTKERDFYRHMKFRHEIERVEWRDEESKWNLGVRDMDGGETFEDKVDFFLELNGPVSKPRFSEIAGIEKFEGEVVHPAYWKDNTSVKGKKVALIGYGCSGVQIAPNIIDDVDSLLTWFRNKTYVLPPPAQAFSAAEGANFKYSDAQKELLKDPDLYLAYRKAIEDSFSRYYPYLINGGKIATQARERVAKYMTDKLASRPGLIEAVLPDAEEFGIGCRRQTFAYGYLEAITHPKSTVLLKPPQTFTKKGLLDAEGVEHELDMVIAATGYDQSLAPRFPKIVNGVDMGQENLKEPLPPYYMALMAKGFPNYFTATSAYAPTPHGNWYQSSEAFAKYIVQCIDKMQKERLLSITPKDRAVEHFTRHSNAWLKRTAVSGPCVAWFKGNDGKSKPPSLWPGARSQFLKIMERPRFEDFKIRYEDEEDMYACFGNGWSADVEGAGEESDRTFYMGTPGREVKRDEIERLRGVDESVTVVSPKDG